MLKKYAPYIIALALVILLFFVFKPKSTARTPITGGGATGGGAGTGGGATTPSGGGTLNRERLLSRGSTGAEVSELQRLLRTEGETLTADGNFGPITEAALQRRRNRTSTTLNQFTAEAATGANTGGAGTPGPTPATPTTAAGIARALWENSGWSATAAGFIAAADGVINATPATLRAADTSARTQYAKGLREILDGTYLLPFYVTANQKRAAAYNAIGAAGL